MPSTRALYGELRRQTPLITTFRQCPQSKVLPKAVEHWRRLQSVARLGRAADPDQICGCCLGQPLGLDQLGETEHQARFELLVAGVADDVGKDTAGASRDALHGITEGL